MHRHQAIVPFLLYDTTKNHGAFNFTSLNYAILQSPRLSAYPLYMTVYIARVVACVAVPVLAASKRTSLQNEFFPSFLPGAAVCCSHYFMSWISSIGEFILCLQTPLSLHNLKTMLQIGRYLMPKYVTCVYSISVPDTSAPHCTYTLLISEHNAPAVIPIRKEA